MPRSVAEYLEHPDHAGPLAGAALVAGAAGGDRLVVRVGFWLDRSGAVARARFQATGCAALIAYAEATCALAEQGVDPGVIDATQMRAAVAGVHPVHHDRADLVALAVARAVQQRTTPGGTP